MPLRYDLSGLSPQAFEHLIHALCIKVLGPTIIPYGDGPDGGRDATFDGPVSYPTRDARWNGYGVIQAKCKQSGPDRTPDTKWVLDTLRKELARFTHRTRSTRRIDYYIFATNIVLTPDPERGSMDRVHALLAEYKQQLGLKGFDVWDYTKICSFLDCFEDIRCSYAAWVTPGDVLARVLETMSPPTRDLTNILYNFLQKELLADQYVNLEQAGHSFADRIPLARVFIDLPVSDRYGGLAPTRARRSSKRQPGFVMSLVNDASDTRRPSALRNRDKGQIGRFVLLGGPGQGKTTLGQFLCQLFRAALLESRPPGATAIEVEHALREIRQQCTAESLQLPRVRRFPVRIALTSLADFLAGKGTEGSRSVLSFLAARVRDKVGTPVLPDDMLLCLRSYPWLLVFDGLDEVPASSNREGVLQAIRDFWVDAADCDADIVVVATSRPQGYNEDFSPSMYQHKWLVPLSSAHAAHYARRLVNARYPADEERRKKVLARLERASREPATARLMTSALQVTIMATLVDRIGQPPQERWGLFKEYYNVVYHREVEREIAAATVLREHRPDIDAIHRNVGLLLQVETGRSGQSEPRLSHAQLSTVVKARLSTEGYRGAQRDALALRIIDAATTRLVFLVGLSDDAVGFEVRSLQEFMAAEALMDATDPIAQRRLQQIAPIPSWRNVFLFAAGKCFAERQYLRDTVLAICAEQNEDPNDHAGRASLLGSQIALDLLEDGAARQQPRKAQALARLALRLCENPPSEQHLVLAELCDVELEELFEDELRSRLLSSEPCRCAGAWACLLALVKRDLGWASALLDQAWPAEPEHTIQLLPLIAASGAASSLHMKLIEAVLAANPMACYGIESRLRAISVPRAHWFSGMVETIDNRSRDQSAHTLNVPDVAPCILFKPTSVRAERSAHMRVLAKLPAGHRAWSLLSGAAQLAETPSKELLGSVLRDAVAQYDKRMLHWFAPRVPWPLGMCLGAADDKTVLNQLASRAAEGALGDARAWHTAEERWQTAGVRTDDFRAAVDQWPFGANIAEVGAPLVGCITQVISHDARDIRGMLSIRKDLPPSEVRSKVASWVLRMISQYYERTATPEPIGISVEEFESLVSDAAKYGIALESLRALFDAEGRLDSKKARAVVDHVGTNCRLKVPRAVSADFATMLWKEYRGELGFLRIVAAICRVVPHIRLAGTLEPSAIKQGDDREAATLVAFACEGLTEETAIELASGLRLIDDLEERTVEAIVQMVREREDDWRAKCLAVLRDELPTFAGKADAEAMSFFVDTIRRRTSGLEHADLWDELDLPVGIRVRDRPGGMGDPTWLIDQRSPR